MNIVNGLLFAQKGSIKDIRLSSKQTYQNFQDEAKVEQIIVIVTKRSVPCFVLAVSASILIVLLCSCFDISAYV